MLLVGSFEPFDEAEARRVGADDILTKPFQSIRRMIDKVGGLLSGKPVAEANPAEMPHVKEEATVPEKLSTEELEITTADTLPLPAAEQHQDYPVYQKVAAVQQPDNRSHEPATETQHPQDVKQETFRESQIMDSPSNELRNESTLEAGDVLLDLGDVGGASTAASDDFALDLDFDEPQSAQGLEAVAISGTHLVEPQLSRRSKAGMDVVQTEQPLSTASMDTSELAYRQRGLPAPSAKSASATDQKFVDTQEWKRESPRSTSDDLQSKAKAGRFERVADEPGDVAPAVRLSGPVNLDQLAPEVIDAIARRAVEHLSAQVVQEIAWEVVPQLAELLIKRKLEENQSLPK